MALIYNIENLITAPLLVLEGYLIYNSSSTYESIRNFIEKIIRFIDKKNPQKAKKDREKSIRNISAVIFILYLILVPMWWIVALFWKDVKWFIYGTPQEELCESKEYYDSYAKDGSSGLRIYIKLCSNSAFSEKAQSELDAYNFNDANSCLDNSDKKCSGECVKFYTRDILQ